MSLLDVFERHRYDPSVVNNSRTWFKQEVQLLSREGVKPKNTFNNSGRVVTNIMPGNLYMFFYDPKHKATLPHYDMFPLVFPFEKTATGFMGLNMHYLSYKLRIGVFENLLKFKNTKGITDMTRLKYSYSMLQGIAKHRLAEHCIKNYLFDHLASPLKLIPATSWVTAMMLPVESFVGASKQEVWKNTGGL